MNRRNWLATAIAGIQALCFGRCAPVKPAWGASLYNEDHLCTAHTLKPLWTHDVDNGDTGYVYDANGADIGPIQRCNIHTGMYEIRIYTGREIATGKLVDITNMHNVSWRTYDVIEDRIERRWAPAPLNVVPLTRESIENHCKRYNGVPLIDIPWYDRNHIDG